MKLNRKVLIFCLPIIAAFFVFSYAQSISRSSPDSLNELRRGVYQFTNSESLASVSYFFIDSKDSSDKVGIINIKGFLRLNFEKFVTIKFRKAYIRRLENQDIKNIFFETEKRRGVSYIFCGEFTGKTISNFTIGKGTLIQLKNGKSIVESFE